jgi:DNA-binding transcriptional MocR family regulator
VTAPTPDRAARRADVARLAQQDLSHRAIAAQLGISKDTVRRDLDYLARAERAAMRQTDASPAPPGAPPAPRGASDEPPGASCAPAVGDRLTIDVGEGLAEDLANLMRTGCTAAAAIYYAVEKMATAYRHALQRGLVTDGEPIEVAAVVIRLGDPLINISEHHLTDDRERMTP